MRERIIMEFHFQVSEIIWLFVLLKYYCNQILHAKLIY